MVAVKHTRTEQSSIQLRRRRAAIEDGLAHGARLFPRDPRPGEPVTVAFTALAARPIDLVAVYFTTDGSEPRGERGKARRGFVVEAEAGLRETDAATGLPVREWRATLPAQPDGTLVRYRAEGWAVRGPRQSFYADRADPVSGERAGGRVFAYSVDTFQAPEWLDDAIIYQVLVDRFSAAEGEPPVRDPGSLTGFYGGTLAGVLDQLEYIQAAGATALWLTPVLESPSHHGYDPASFYYVAKRYGTNETLRRLIREAHQREMKVILDFVANHTSTEHPLFQRAQADPESTLRAWYTFGDYPPHGYRTYALVEGMPELNTDHPDVRRYLTTAARFWLSELGADGLRLDYVTGPSRAFWTIFQREIKRDFPQALTLGEVTEPASELATYAGRMDAVMDFPLATHLREVFARRAEPLE
ncbi:MAG TPA: alpha-amylase family glycosyl hydrolase, partial [Ktedonobacterales bacterium]